MKNQFDDRSLPFPRSHPVATIAIAQLFGTSLWFSANSAAPDLMRAWSIGVSGIGFLTNAVQLGFIIGTSTFALSGLADRFPASRIFVVSALLGATFNGCFAIFSHGLLSAAFFRFLVGICLAGIYPIGMKLIVSWEPKRTGSALAYLVGMLTLGTALPQGVRFLGARWELAGRYSHFVGIGDRRRTAGVLVGRWSASRAAAESGSAAHGRRAGGVPVVGWPSGCCAWLLWPHVGALYILDAGAFDSECGFKVTKSRMECSGARIRDHIDRGAGVHRGRLHQPESRERARGCGIAGGLGILLFDCWCGLERTSTECVPRAVARVGSSRGRGFSAVFRLVGCSGTVESGGCCVGIAELNWICDNDRFDRASHISFQPDWIERCVGVAAGAGVGTDRLLSSMGEQRACVIGRGEISGGCEKQPRSGLVPAKSFQAQS